MSAPAAYLTRRKSMATMVSKPWQLVAQAKHGLVGHVGLAQGATKEQAGAAGAPGPEKPGVEHLAALRVATLGGQEVEADVAGIFLPAEAGAETAVGQSDATGFGVAVAGQEPGAALVLAASACSPFSCGASPASGAAPFSSPFSSPCVAASTPRVAGSSPFAADASPFATGASPSAAASVGGEGAGSALTLPPLGDHGALGRRWRRDRRLSRPDLGQNRRRLRLTSETGQQASRARAAWSSRGWYLDDTSRQCKASVARFPASRC